MATITASPAPLHRAPLARSGFNGRLPPPADERLVLPDPLGAVLRRLGRMVERRRQRRALMALDDRLLHDIGLTRADVRKEAGRPLWD